MGDQVCSEVHSFIEEATRDEKCSSETQLASFRFTLPVGWAAMTGTAIIAEAADKEDSADPASIEGIADIAEPADIEEPADIAEPADLDDQVYDSDGDVVVPRRGVGVSPDSVLIVEHQLSTTLSAVGRQVWRGSLLLADYLLNCHTQLDGHNVLEVGSGTGLAAIIAAACGAKVLATDLDQMDILDIIKRNVERNKVFIRGSVAVTALDLTEDLDTAGEVAQFLKRTDIVIAGDIVYDDDVTDSFVTFIKAVMEKVPVDERHFVVAMEKRFVFTIQDLDTVAPAYDFFMKKLEHLKSNLPVGFTMSVVKLGTDFPQHFCYQRVKEMVLYRISFIKTCDLIY